MNWFQHHPGSRDAARRVRSSQQAGDDIDATYAESIAIHEITYDTYRRDFSRDQWGRWLQFVASINGNFDLGAAVFARWLVDEGRIGR